MQTDLTLKANSESEAGADGPARPLPTTSTSNFRLLAGLTSFRSNLCLSHLAASGPEGILASRLIRHAGELVKSARNPKAEFRRPNSELRGLGWPFSSRWRHPLA